MAVDLNQEIKNFDLKQWLSFEGRIGRQTWWLQYVLVILGINVAAQIVLAIIGAIDFTGGFVALLLSLLWMLVAIAMIWPALAGYAKRLHDRDMSAWWILMALIPAVGGLAFTVLDVGLFISRVQVYRDGVYADLYMFSEFVPTPDE